MAAPSVTLAGQVWPIPLLAVRQNRIVVPALRTLLALDLTRISPEEVDLLADALYAGLTRGHPDLTRAEFDDMPITMLEMFRSIEVLAAQTGLYSLVSKDTLPAGEV